MSIIVDNISYIYEKGTGFERQALKNVSCAIEDGEFIGLIGHTGSGKSTFIQHLNGLVKPTEGHIYYNGKDIYEQGFNMKELRSRVGLVFQYPEHQLFESDVLSDVCFGPMNQGMTREQAEEERKNKISNVQVGLVTEGVVESLQPYGAFVDLGNGLSGLVHISQICEKRIKKPSEALAVGDRVKVKVTAVKDGKLSLSIKEATDMMAKEIEEEVIELPDSKEEASTSLGALFANLKLN